jgi:hypothetical protein
MEAASSSDGRDPHSRAAVNGAHWKANLGCLSLADRGSEQKQSETADEQ